jgi:hypothetical protein
VKFLAERTQFLVKMFGGLERVVKFVAIAMGIFASLKILTGIGLLISALRGMAAMLGLVSIEAWLIPAALIALLLIMEDIYTFTQGGDSFFGDLVNVMKKTFPNAIAGVVGAFNWIKSSIATVSDTVSLLIETISNLFKLFAQSDIGVKFFQVISDMATTLYGNISGIAGVMGKMFSFVGGAVKDAVSDTAGAVGALAGYASKAGSLAVAGVSSLNEKVKGQLKPETTDRMAQLGNVMTAKAPAMAQASAQVATPQQVQPTGQSTSNNVDQKNTFNANVSIAVPAGTSQKAATSIVKEGVGEAFNSILRQTRNQAVGGVAY